MPLLFHEARVPTAFGLFRLRVYDEGLGGRPIAIIARALPASAPALVRIHSSCFIAENLGSLGCDCRHRLDFALERISLEGGVIVYLGGDSRGRGLAAQIQIGAAPLIGHGIPDQAGFETAAAVLRNIDTSTIRLLTDDPSDADSLTAHGIEVTALVPMGTTERFPSSGVMDALTAASGGD